MLLNHNFTPAPVPDADAAAVYGIGEGLHPPFGAHPGRLSLVPSSEPGGHEASQPARPTATGASEALFSKLELLVIGIGDRDPPARLAPDGRLARLRRLLFGIAAPAPFANPRLEALRSLASALRHRRRDPDVKVVAALAAGITPEQIENLKARNQSTGA